MNEDQIEELSEWLNRLLWVSMILLIGSLLFIVVYFIISGYLWIDDECVPNIGEPLEENEFEVKIMCTCNTDTEDCFCRNYYELK